MTILYDWGLQFKKENRKIQKLPEQFEQICEIDRIRIRALARDLQDALAVSRLTLFGLFYKEAPLHFRLRKYAWGLATSLGLSAKSSLTSGPNPIFNVQCFNGGHQFPDITLKGLPSIVLLDEVQVLAFRNTISHGAIGSVKFDPKPLEVVFE